MKKTIQTLFITFCLFMNLVYSDSPAPSTTSYFKNFFSDVRGKVDAGPAWVYLDVLESGKTVDTLKLKSIKADAFILVYGGFCLKPNLIYGTGDGDLLIGGIGFGHYFPLFEKWTFTPSVGVTWSALHTHIDIEEFGLFDLKEKFHSVSPYLALDFSYKITKKLYVLGLVQYAWSRTHTIIKPLVHDKSYTSGPNYNIGLEYSLNDNWAINCGYGYNITLSREKHGLRANGLKIGSVYYF